MKTNIIVLAVFLLASCSSDHHNDFYFPYLTLSPGSENLDRLTNLEFKTVQFRDSIGNKLNFKSGQVMRSSTKCDLDNICNAKKFDLEIQHHLLSLISENFFLEYRIELHLDNLCNSFDQKVIANFELTDMNSKSRNNILMPNTDKPNDPENINFGNRFVGDTSFKRVDYMGDTSGHQINYQNIWSSGFKVEEIPRNTCLDARHIWYQKTNIPNEEQFFFNKEFGIVAFCLKDGNLWVLHQIH